VTLVYDIHSISYIQLPVTRLSVSVYIALLSWILGDLRFGH
jgi:hypothetical protein